MKKILIYNSQKAHSVLYSNINSLEEGFRQCGYETFQCNLDDMESSMEGYRLLTETDEVLFSVGFNDIGMWVFDGEKRTPLYEDLDTPHVSYLVDNPYNPCVRGADVLCRNHLVTMLNQNSEEIMRACHADVHASTMFLPLAGSSCLSADEVFSSERIYDVVFCAGTFGDIPPKRVWRQDGTPKEIARILDDVADFGRCHAVTVWDAAKEVLKFRGMCEDIFLQRLVPYLGYEVLYLKGWRRLRALELLVENGIPVDVFGGGWEEAPFADKLRIHGSCSYEESLDIFSKAKIVYQDQAEFNHGAHDRVFTAMLNGAVVVTEYSDYLEKEFEPGHDLFMYDWQHGEEQVRIIPELLADETRRLSVALSAYGKADKGHRWRNRAERMAEAVRLLYEV